MPTAMMNPTISPFGPPKYSPRSISKPVSAPSSKVVFRPFIVFLIISSAVPAVTDSDGAPSPRPHSCYLDARQVVSYSSALVIADLYLDAAWLRHFLLGKCD